MNKTKKLRCHPKNKSKKSCLTPTVLNELKTTWNQRHPDKKIKTNDPDKIEKQLKKYNSLCNNELCLIETSSIKNKEQVKEKLFAPFTPLEWKKDKNTWLNSLDITNVMRQYEESYPSFKFLGPSPIDFDERQEASCVWPELCNFDINKMEMEGKTKIGIIFNLDPHYKSGSHWICLFIDLNKKYILFLDSNGTNIPPEILKLKNKIMAQSKYPLKYYHNKGLAHQRTNTECGMYCLYTIITLLTNQHSPKYFITKRIPDQVVEKYRQIYFNPID